MCKVAWAIDGHGQQWPWCEDCGKAFGPVNVWDIEHRCEPSGEVFQARRIYQDSQGEWVADVESKGYPARRSK